MESLQEKWKKWQPINGLGNRYEIDRIGYVIKGDFKILFSEYRDMGKRVTVIFKNGIYAHRKTDESFRLQTYEMLDDNYGKDFYTKWAFFKLTNSLYIKELSTQSLGFADSYPLTHYAFLTVNSILDVVAACEPIVKILD